MKSNKVYKSYHKLLQQKCNSIVKKIENLLNELNIKEVEKHTKYIKRCYALSKCPEIDYDDCGATFTYLYFYRNFFKAVHVFKQETLPFVEHIVDVGSGPGADLIAFLSILDVSISCKRRIDVTLVDKSKTQLTLAKKILESINNEFKNLNISYHYKCEDFKNFNFCDQNADIVLFSHILNENQSKTEIFLNKASSIISKTGKIFVIERTKDEKIWGIIEKSVLNLPMNVDKNNISFAASKLLLKRDPKKNKIETKYLVLSYPIQKVLIYLLGRYFYAWETQSLDLLERIFVPKAKYVDKPFKKPIDGLKQIEQYWIKNVLMQNKIRTKILSFSVNNNSIYAEWESEFINKSKNFHLMGMLILDVDTMSNQIYELREYYRSE